MKYGFKLGFCVFVLFSTNVLASHDFGCQLTTEIIKIDNLARLNGISTRRGNVGDPVDIVRDHEQTVTLKVVTVDSVFGRDGCGFKSGDMVTLSVKYDEVDVYAANDILSLTYSNFGDSLGSTTVWNVL